MDLQCPCWHDRIGRVASSTRRALCVLRARTCRYMLHDQASKRAFSHLCASHHTTWLGGADTRHAPRHPCRHRHPRHTPTANRDLSGTGPASARSTWVDSSHVAGKVRRTTGGLSYGGFACIHEQVNGGRGVRPIDPSESEIYRMRTRDLPLATCPSSPH